MFFFFDVRIGQIYAFSGKRANNKRWVYTILYLLLVYGVRKQEGGERGLENM